MKNLFERLCWSFRAAVLGKSWITLNGMEYHAVCNMYRCECEECQDTRECVLCDRPWRKGNN